METLKWYFMNQEYVVYTIYCRKKQVTQEMRRICSLWVSQQGQLTSVWASAGWWVTVRVRHPLPTRPGRMGKGILDQPAELGPPAWKSGQLRPVNQMKGRKCKNQREEGRGSGWKGEKHNVQRWPPVHADKCVIGRHIWPVVTGVVLNVSTADASLYISGLTFSSNLMGERFDFQALLTCLWPTTFYMEAEK